MPANTIRHGDPEPSHDTVWGWPDHPMVRLWWVTGVGWTTNNRHGFGWADLVPAEFPITEVAHAR